MNSVCGTELWEEYAVGSISSIQNVSSSCNIGIIQNFVSAQLYHVFYLLVFQELDFLDLLTWNFWKVHCKTFEIGSNPARELITSAIYSIQPNGFSPVHSFTVKLLGAFESEQVSEVWPTSSSELYLVQVHSSTLSTSYMDLVDHMTWISAKSAGSLPFSVLIFRKNRAFCPHTTFVSFSSPETSSNLIFTAFSDQECTV